MDLHCVPSHLAAAPSHQAALTHRAETSRPIAIRSMAYSLPARERSTGSRVPASMDLHCVPSHLAAAPSHQAALTHRAETSRPIAIR
ncbi:hypothetical protein, partial [Escherichia coli]|uniref:hypothetical protein n=1 Tax=Escherichia coli TaxID=562 RepID=UPI000BC68218